MPVLTRWVIALVSVFWSVFLGIVMVRKAPGDAATWLKAGFFFAIAIGAVLLAVFGYRKKPADLEAFEWHPDDWPTEQDREHMFVFERVGLTGEMHRVILDPIKRWLYFENEYTPRAFLSRTQKYHACSVDEVLCAREVHVRNGAFLLLLLEHGKATPTPAVFIPSSLGRGYQPLLSALRELGVPSVGGPELESGRTMIFGQFYALIGGVAGALTTAPGMSDFNFYGRILGGAALGVALFLFVVWAGQKLFGLRLMLPMIGVLIGGVLGGFLGYFVARVFDLEFLRVVFGGKQGWTYIILGFTLLGCAGGAALGGIIQRAKEMESEAIRHRAKTAGLREV